VNQLQAGSDVLDHAQPPEDTRMSGYGGA
jgi:hypothetical protein